MTADPHISAGRPMHADHGAPRRCFARLRPWLPRWAALLTGCVLFLSAASAMAADAVVIALSGSVSADRTMPGGSIESRTLRARAEVSQGDLVRTGKDGRAQLRFSDGGLVSLQPDTEFRIDEYQFAGDHQRALFTLLRGALRTATGAVGKRNRDDYRLRTPTATVGIRGTEYLAEQTICNPVCSPGPSAGLRVSVTHGLIAVMTPVASLDVGVGQSALVKRPDSAPQFTSSGPVLAPRSLNEGGSKTNSESEKSETAATDKTEAKAASKASTEESKTAETTADEKKAEHATSTGETKTGAATASRSTAGGSTTGETAESGTAAGTTAAHDTAAGTASGHAQAPADAANVDKIAMAGGETSSAGASSKARPVPSLTADFAAPGTATPEAGSAAGLPSNSGRLDGDSTGIPGVFSQPPSPPVDDALSSNTGRDPQGGLAVLPGNGAVPGTGGSPGAGGGATSEPESVPAGKPDAGSGSDLGTGGGHGHGTGMGGGNGHNDNNNGGGSGNIDGNTGGGEHTGGTSGNSGGGDNVGGTSGGGENTGGGHTGGDTPPPVEPHPVLGETGTIGGKASVSVAGLRGGTLSSGDLQRSGTYRLANADGVATLQSIGARCPYVNCVSQGSANVAEAGSTAYTAWGRWTSGTVLRTVLFLPQPVSIGKNQGVHYVVGVPSATVPTHGVFGYALIGATSPTLSNGSIAPGSFEGQAAVQFDSVQLPRIGLEGLVTFAPGTPRQATLGFATEGGVANPGQSSLQTNQRFGFADHSLAVQQGGVDPAGCKGGRCTVNLNGGLFGPDAAQLGFTYSIGSNRNAARTVDGAAVFGKVESP